ncbi:putative Organic solute transport protein 1 [Trypanosoma cruzi]|nr:putative Organic solute transport protein 1 [Trypanosoma cruzi]
MAIGSLAFLVLNYGAEMIFILHTRLIAQNVEKEMAETVMNDMVRHMFSPEFLAELFRPQPLYSYSAVKEIFKSLTEMSVMRLSPLSMNKLFELMAMGVKYQLFTLRHPLELVEMTWTHLEELKRLITPEAQAKVTPVFVMLEGLCSRLTHGDLAEIRKELLNFIAGRSTVISVLFEEGMQSDRGSFVLPVDRVLPPLSICEPPGSIRYFKNGKLDASTAFEHRDAVLRHPSSVPLDKWDPKNAGTRMTKNGTNIYAPSRQEASTRAEANGPTSLLPSMSSMSRLSTVPTAVPSDIANVATGELNYLSRFVGCGQNAPQKMFKLKFFDDVEEEMVEHCVGGGEKGSKMGGATDTVGDRTAASTIPLVRMTKADVESQNKELFKIMDGLRVDETRSGPPEGGNDLLDIMDED